jgi:glycosyltransferase involved in cell wall biosynthesis
VSQEPPSFDLVVATVDRAEELGRFLDSLEAQRYPRARVIVVDQGDVDAAVAALEGRSLEIIRLRSQRGLSRARNEALPHLRADLVAFPDDDCTYPEGLLERVAVRFSADRGLDGLTGRAEDASGRSASSWKADRAVLTDDNLWNRANAATIFLGSGVVRRTGAFDERLGLGSGEACSSGEEIDYLIRAIRAGARIEYDPSLVVLHDVRTQDERLGYRDGASIGYVLRKHAYPRRVVARMLVRPLGGTLVALARLDPALARYRLATLRGRIRGLRAWERAL